MDWFDTHQKDIQKDLKELNELDTHQKEERYNPLRECAQTYKDYDELKMSKHNLWMECEEHKKSMSFLNNELLKYQELKGQPQDIVKLHEEIKTLDHIIQVFQWNK